MATKKKKRDIWLDRTLTIGPHLALCTSEEQFVKAIRDLKIVYIEPWVGEGSDGVTHAFTCRNGLACIVCVRPSDENSYLEMVGLIVHEAVHVWQQFVSFIGETTPSEEFEAYSIQSIAQTLIEAYDNARHDTISTDSE